MCFCVYVGGGVSKLVYIFNVGALYNIGLGVCILIVCGWLDGRVGGGGGGGTDHQQPINQSHSMVLFISVRSNFFLFWVLAYLPFEGGGLLQDDGREHCLFFGGLSVCIV